MISNSVASKTKSQLRQNIKLVMQSMLNDIWSRIEKKHMYKKYAYSYFVITANKFCENLVNIFLCLCFLKIFVGFLITLLQDK